MAGRRKPVDRKRRSSRKAVRHKADVTEPFWRKEDIPKVCAQVTVLVGQLDATDSDIADFYGMSERTLYRYKVKYPEIAKAMIRAEEKLVRMVEQSLIKSATGFKRRALKIMQHDGIPILVEHEEHITPSVTAQVAFLKAKKPNEYSDKIQHSGDPKQPMAFIIEGWTPAPPKGEKSGTSGQ